MKIKEFVRAINEEKRKKERAKTIHNVAVEIGTVIVLCLTTTAIFSTWSKTKVCAKLRNNCNHCQCNLL